MDGIQASVPPIAETSRKRNPRKAVTKKKDPSDDPPPPKKKRTYKTKAMKLAEAQEETAIKERQAAQQSPMVTTGNLGQGGSDGVKVEVQAAVAGPSTVVRGAEASGSNSTKVVTVQQKAPRKSKAKTVPPGDGGRLSRERKSCPQAVWARASRVMSQRMFLVDRRKIDGDSRVIEQFMILGSTGNVYTVNIGQSPKCNCPDCAIRKSVPCKHIIFVFLKVLKVPNDSHLWYQQSLIPTELESIFSNAPPTPAGSVAVATHIRSAYRQAAGLPDDAPAPVVEEAVVEVQKEVKAKRDVIGDDCPVCYSEMTAEEEAKNLLVYDESENGCGNALHKECFQMWTATVSKKGERLTCVWCRSPWVSATSQSTSKKGVPIANIRGVQRNGGYVNMAELAGMSTVRDTSTYYRGPVPGLSMLQAKARWDAQQNDGDY